VTPNFLIEQKIRIFFKMKNVKPNVIVLLLIAIIFFKDSHASDTEFVEVSSVNNSFIYNSSVGALMIRRQGNRNDIPLKILVRDEQGGLLANYGIPRQQHNLEIRLNGKGFYSISVDAESGANRAESVVATAVVAGESLGDAIRRQSSVGLWHVHGSLSELASTGAGWSRRMFSLKDYQIDATGKVVNKPLPVPTDGRFTPSSGFNWIGTLAFGLPAWMRKEKGPLEGVYPPDNWDQLRQLAETFASDVPMFPPFFELYNEPEVHWRGTDADLVRFLHVLGAGIKKVHPTAKVLVPGFATIDLPRLKRLVQLGLFVGVDGVVVHAYVNGTAPEAEFIRKVRDLRAYLVEIGKKDFPIFITEFGWSTREGSWQKPVSELVQAQYASRSLVLLKAEDVRAAIYYCLNFKNDNPGQAGFSIMHADGKPKPAFAAFSNAARWLSGASDGRLLSLSSGVQLALFKGGNFAVAWSDDLKQRTYLPNFPNVLMEDMMGRAMPRPGSTSISLQGGTVFWKMPDSDFYGLQQHGVSSGKVGDEFSTSLESVMMPEGIDLVRNGLLRISSRAEKGVYLIFGKASGIWRIHVVDVK
jgi:hypothetical protein